MARIGIQWVKNYHGRADDLSTPQKDAERFYNKLSGTKEFNWGDDDAWDMDLEEYGIGSPPKGFDELWADKVHIMFFSGHGNITGPVYGVDDKDDGIARFTEVKWGNGRLNWIAFSACKILNHNPLSDIFLVSNINAALTREGYFSNKTYFFVEDCYIRYNWEKHKVDKNYPKPVQDNWGNWPASFNGGLDASVNGAKRRRGKAFFFKADEYIRYDWDSSRVDAGYPRKIKDHWTGFPEHFTCDLDAALLGQGSREGKAYFFKGGQYIRFDWGDLRVDPGYPKLIADGWPGLPASFASDFDAAFDGMRFREGKAYFFKGGQYIRYDWDQMHMDSGYPLDIVGNWQNWPREYDNVFTRWKGAFDGLHAMLGFHTVSTTRNKRGRYFAGYLNEGHTVIEAWRKACIETESSKREWAYLRAGGGAGVDTYNDHWYGEGFVSPDPDGTYFAYSKGVC